MTSRKKSVDKSSEFEAFIEQTSDYLPPSTNKDGSTQTTKQSTKQLDKHSSKQINSKGIARKKKVSIGDLFAEPVAKEKTG